MLSRIVELHDIVHVHDGEIVWALKAREPQSGLPRSEHAGLFSGALADTPHPLGILAEQKIRPGSARERQGAPSGGCACAMGKGGHGISLRMTRSYGQETCGGVHMFSMGIGALS